MHILVTNDDGVHAPGLLALAQVMDSIGQVSVFAPDRNWSASGHVKTLDRPIRIRETRLSDGRNALTTDSAPSDCVALAMLGAVSQKIDLVVSGINPNANVGYDVTYSGTVTAAMEAVIGGIPAIAVSVNAYEYHAGSLDYSTSARVIGDIVRKFLEYNDSRQMLLNVNIPYLPLDELKGFRVTRLGKRLYRDVLEKRMDPRNSPYYWYAGDPPTGIPEEGTDIGALAGNFVSITPIHLDMTDHLALERISAWRWNGC